MLIDLIKKRQSTRKYLTTPVTREDIEKCIEAARLAPSACNSQPWHFIVVDDPELKMKLAERIFSGPYAMNAFAKEAPVLIVVMTEKTSAMAQIGGSLRGTSYPLIDIGIAVEHLVLQAAELDLATCWIGWFNEKEAKKILGIPSDKKVDCVIPLGYAAEPERDKNRKTIDQIRSFNRLNKEET
jgi:nitroreductase